MDPRSNVPDATTASRTTAWRAGPARPGPLDATVHVWRADLARVDPSIGGLLSGAERARAERISHARRRELWQRSRGLLRALLARYLRGEPRELPIAVAPNGKPELADGDARLWFNLSHSGDLALYAFAADGPVGVDVQLERDPSARRARDHVALAARSLGDDDARWLRALDPSRREAEFVRLWTRHEAELKRRGTGIGAAGTQTSDGPAPWIVELDVAPRAAAALACTVAPRELRLWCWR